MKNTNQMINSCNLRQNNKIVKHAKKPFQITAYTKK